MIFVVEQPPDREPKAWFAYDRWDLLRKVAAGDALQEWDVWDCASPRELLAMFDSTPDAPDARERFPGLWALGTEDGWDTSMYRAAYLPDGAMWRTEPITVEAACVAALQARGPCMVFLDESGATAAFERSDLPQWQGTGWRARWALREQLIATEILADDL